MLHMRFVSILLVLVSAATVGAADFENLEKKPVSPPLAGGSALKSIMISGRLTAGRNDPVGKNEYFIRMITLKDQNQRPGRGLGVAIIDVVKLVGKMKPGQVADFSAVVSLDNVRRYREKDGYAYLMFRLMEEDVGRGWSGTVDTVILLLTGGFHDNVARTKGIQTDDLEKRLPLELECGPTWTGTHLKLKITAGPDLASGSVGTERISPLRYR